MQNIGGDAPEDDGPDVVVKGHKPRAIDDSGGDSGGGGGGNGSGGGSGGGRGSRLPAGYKPYGDGSKYMVDPDGKLDLTPVYKARIDAGEIDWWGVTEDLATIVLSSATGVLSGPAKYATGALLAGLKSWSQMNGTEPPKQ